MIKLNNKGFAVSTVLYSLILMLLLIVMMIMSTMASNRSNNNELISAVEKELEGIGKSKMELKSGDKKELPFTGLYRIELSDGTNFYTWYSELEKGCSATYDGSEIVFADGCNKTYKNDTSLDRKIYIENANMSASAKIEFMGEEVNANNLGLQDVEEITSGNYYITITIDSTVYILDNDNDDDTVKPGNFNSEKVWNITTMKDVYSEKISETTTNTSDEKGNRVLDISTNKALEVFTSQIPISGTKLKAETYFSFDNPKKWIFDRDDVTNQYYICNVAMDAYAEETDVKNKGKHCRTNSKSVPIEGGDATIHIDPLVLTYVPSSDPATPGSFEFRNICNPDCTAEDVADRILDSTYQKFTLYRKS